MKECKTCDLAIYCFSDADTWVFRTKQEMEEKQAEIARCPVHQENRNSPAHCLGDNSGNGAQGAQEH